MLRVTIPGFGELELEHLVLDYNGTLACEGELLPGVRELLESLASQLTIHILTADTFGHARRGVKDMPCELFVLQLDDEAEGKAAYIRRLGPSSVVCVGNGRNDRLMLKDAGLGIAVILEEGAAAATLVEADIVCRSITSALGLLANPLRLVATLRS
jgi:soluble P-type ATPase